MIAIGRLRTGLRWLLLAQLAVGLLGCVDIYAKHTMVLTRQMNETKRSANFS